MFRAARSSVKSFGRAHQWKSVRNTTALESSGQSITTCPRKYSAQHSQALYGAVRSASGATPTIGELQILRCGSGGLSSVAGTPFATRSISTTSVASGEIVKFPLPQTGEGIAECEVVRWCVQEGDYVTQFQPLCEVQSDKASIEITSRYEGTITKIHFSEGDVAEVGATLLEVRLKESASSPKASAPATPSAPAESPPKPPSAAPSSSSAPAAAPVAEKPLCAESRALATPAVRRLAREHGIDLSDVPGSGKDGRVTKCDVLAYLDPSAAPAPSQAGAEAAAGAPAPARAAGVPAGEDTVIKLRGYARAMSKQMTVANTVPHFTYCDDVSMDRLLRTRAALRHAHPKLTSLPLILKALSVALEKHPALNATVDAAGAELTQHRAHNIGCAVATPNGLVVPVVKHVNLLTITEIAAELDRLNVASQTNKLDPADLEGGTVTVSNIGSIGGAYATPIINVPQVAILALGRTRQTPVVRPDGQIAASALMPVSWSADHRVVDGAVVATFCNEWKALLEEPERLLLHLK